MLKIIKRESILWPVKVYIPRDDGSGKTDAGDIKIRYKLLSISERKEMAETKESLHDYVKARVLGWEGIADDNGPVEFSDSAKDWLFDIPYIEKAIVDTFLEAQTKATEKN